MEERAFIALDASSRELVWPGRLHELQLEVFKVEEGGLLPFVAAVRNPARAEGIVVVCPPSGLNALISDLKQGLAEAFGPVMQKTLVVATEEDDTGHSPMPALKRLHGFRSLELSAWSERHIGEFIGNIFQPPAARLMAPGSAEGAAATTSMADYYELLGLQRDASPQELGAALRSYRQYWSERAGEDASRAMAQYSLVMIGQAEAMLLDPVRRQRYDAILDMSRDPRPAQRAAQAGPEPRGRSSADAGNPADEDIEEQIVKEAMSDPELYLLPGLGVRRQAPGTDPWPPDPWPAEDWPTVALAKFDEVLQFDDDIDAAGRAPGAASLREPFDAPSEPATPGLERALERLVPKVDPAPAVPLQAPPRDLEMAISQLAGDGLVEVSGHDRDIVVWAAPDFADNLAHGAGYLVGARLDVGRRRIFLVTGARPLAAGPAPTSRLGFYVEGAPGVPSRDKLHEQVRARGQGLFADDLVLVLDRTASTGQFFVELLRPLAPRAKAPGRPVSLRVPLATWRIQKIARADRQGWQRFRWRAAAAALLCMAGLGAAIRRGAFAALLAPPPLGRLVARTYAQGDAVVSQWQGRYDRVAILRIDAEDPRAHWKLLGTAPGDQNEALDPGPLRRPGDYRYLLLATTRAPLRVAISRIQSVAVR